MTENERVLRDIIIDGNGFDYDESISQSVFEEIQQYRELGTIEEILKVFNNQRTIIATQHETLKQYRAIGTVEALQDMKTNYYEAVSDWRQYRKIGTIEEFQKLKALLGNENLEISETATKILKEYPEYLCIGTIEEFNALKEKSVAKKPIRKEMPYSEETGFNEEWYCPVCGAYVGYFTEGMSEPEQMEYCNECGQHIAKDWGEDDD